MEASAAEYHFKINGGRSTPGKRQTTRPAGERMLTNLTRQTQTVWADSLHVSKQAKPMSLHRFTDEASCVTAPARTNHV